MPWDYDDRFRGPRPGEEAETAPHGRDSEQGTDGPRARCRPGEDAAGAALPPSRGRAGDRLRLRRTRRRWMDTGERHRLVSPSHLSALAGAPARLERNARMDLREGNLRVARASAGVCHLVFAAREG